jgi:ubiquitin C-terminal hydrolase
MNSVLQPLVHCPPFYHLFKDLSLPPANSSSTRLLTAMMRLVASFSEKKEVDGREVYGNAFAPEWVYDAILHEKRFEGVKGRQEDAEEFLRGMLDGLHEEFCKLNEREKVNGKVDDWMEVGRGSKVANTRSVRPCQRLTIV